MAAAVIIGLVVGAVAWFYHRGDREGAIVRALQDNTLAAQEVTKELKDFKAETLKTLVDHGWEIKILKDKMAAIEDTNAP